MLKNIGKKTVGMLWGVAIASGVLTICVLGLLRVAPVLFPEWQSGHAPFLEWLAIVGIPEGGFMTAACALWRKKGQRPPAYYWRR